MAYKVSYTKNFNKDVEKCRKRGYNMSRLKAVLDTLIETGTVPSSCRPHKLSGNHAGEWECHIGPDWLLIWEQNDTELTLLMLCTGSWRNMVISNKVKSMTLGPSKLSMDTRSDKELLAEALEEKRSLCSLECTVG